MSEIIGGKREFERIVNVNKIFLLLFKRMFKNKMKEVLKNFMLSIKTFI